MKIYLVLHHRGGMFGGGGCGREISSHSHDQRMTYPRIAHDGYCHCLLVYRETYKTREDADTVAEKLGTENPGDCCWSLEVQGPE